MTDKRVSRYSARVIRRYIFLFAVMWLLASFLIIVADGFTDTAQEADVAVILGTTVHPDGRIGDYLRTRLEKGLQIYQKGFVKHIVVSGQVGIEGVDEAHFMKEYLVAHGVPDSLVIMDNKGNNTWATAQNFARIRQQHHFRSVIVVSQFFHIARTRFAFWKNGISPVYTAHADRVFLSDLYATLREVIGFYAYLFK